MNLPASDPDLEWLRDLASRGIGYGRSETLARMRFKRLVARIEAVENYEEDPRIEIERPTERPETKP